MDDAGLKLQWRMIDIIAFAEHFVSAHGAGFPDGLAASIVAEENVRRHYARHGARISDHELAVFGQEIVLAFNRMVQAEEKRRRGEWLECERPSFAQLSDEDKAEFAAAVEWGMS